MKNKYEEMGYTAFDTPETGHVTTHDERFKNVNVTQGVNSYLYYDNINDMTNYLTDISAEVINVKSEFGLIKVYDNEGNEETVNGITIKIENDSMTSSSRKVTGFDLRFNDLQGKFEKIIDGKTYSVRNNAINSWTITSDLENDGYLTKVNGFTTTPHLYFNLILMEEQTLITIICDERPTLFLSDLVRDLDGELYNINIINN